MTTNKSFAPAAVYQEIAALAVILPVVFAVTTYGIHRWSTYRYRYIYYVSLHYG
jgi:hypothetical protein